MKGIKSVATCGVSKFGITFYKIYSIVMYVCWAIILFLFVFRGAYRYYAFPVKYRTEVVCAAKEFDLDCALVFAVIKVESGFDKKALSRAGSIGLMQLQAETADFVAFRLGVGKYDLYDAKTNIRFGCYYLKYLFNKFDNQKTVLAAYNAGEGNVKQWLQNKEYSDDGVMLKTIPYYETAEYVKKIEKSLIKYKKLYGNILDKR